MSDASAPSKPVDGGGWLAVAAGTIGALMATLDTSIVSASLPTIQGEIGASGAEGTWITTAYLVAEIVMIPIAGWLGKIFGLRTFLLLVTVLFTAFSMLCGVSHDLNQMIIGRVGQGFTGGAMIPMALIIVATRLPPSQQPLGIALFGMTAVLGPVLGPVIGGWMTEHISWHYAFFLNLPIGIGLLALLTLGLEGARARWEMFREADVLGILGLALGLGGLTIVLEEGQRELWFESDLILTLALVSALGFGLLAAGQFVSKSPVLHLKILFQRAFGSVFLLSPGGGGRALWGLLHHPAVPDPGARLHRRTIRQCDHDQRHPDAGHARALPAAGPHHRPADRGRGGSRALRALKFRRRDPDPRTPPAASFSSPNCCAALASSSHCSSSTRRPPAPSPTSLPRTRRAVQCRAQPWAAPSGYRRSAPCRNSAPPSIPRA